MYQEICDLLAKIHGELGPKNNKEFNRALKDAEYTLLKLKKFY